MGLSVWPGGISQLSTAPDGASGATERRGDTKGGSWRAETKLIYNGGRERQVGDRECLNSEAGADPQNSRLCIEKHQRKSPVSVRERLMVFPGPKMLRC